MARSANPSDSHNAHQEPRWWWRNHGGKTPRMPPTAASPTAPCSRRHVAPLLLGRHAADTRHAERAASRQWCRARWESLRRPSRAHTQLQRPRRTGFFVVTVSRDEIEAGVRASPRSTRLLNENLLQTCDNRPRRPITRTCAPFPMRRSRRCPLIRHSSGVNRIADRGRPRMRSSCIYELSGSHIPYELCFHRVHAQTRPCIVK